MKTFYKFFFLLSILALLFIANRYDFYKNLEFDNESHFRLENDTQNSWVIGSLLLAREKGLFFKGPFTTRFLKKPKKGQKFKFSQKSRYQMDIYLANQELSHHGSWQVYKSAIRWTAHFSTIVDILCNKILKKNINSILVTRTIFDIFTSISLLLLILWAYREFGVLGFLSMLSLCILFPRTNSSDILGSIFVYIFPISFLLIRYQKQIEHRLFLFILFFTVVQQCMSYETTPIVFISGFLPLIYYSISQNWEKIKILKHCKIIFFASTLAVLLVICVHFSSLVYLYGFSESSSWFTGKLIQRTYSEISATGIGEIHKISKGSQMTVLEVLKKWYIEKKVWFGINGLGYFFINLILIAVLNTLVCKYKKNIFLKQCLALSTVCFCSFFSTLCYFIIFKAQAATHNFVVKYFEFPFYFLLFFAIILIVMRFIIHMYRISKSLILSKMNEMR